MLATAKDKKSKALFGRIECLAKEHGSLAHALETAVQVGHNTREGLVTLSGHFDTFCDGLKDCILKTTLMRDILVKLMGRVQANEAKRSQALAACVSALKQMVSPLGTATAIAPVVNAPVVQASGTIDADTSFGTGHIVSMPMEITMNSQFDKIKDLEAKVHILQEHAQNMGIIFHCIAFSSETMFNLWYFAQNPSGKGLAAVVDIMSIWQFLTLDGDSNVNTWLAEKRHVKNFGYKHNVDAKYVHSMSVQYPAAFAGTKKEAILTTTTIAMLKSIIAWHGNDMGDGIKDRLTTQMHTAVERHACYCEENLPKGTLRVHAVRSAECTQYFWQTLAAYIEAELTMLLSFNLTKRDVLLLMSNQIVQILMIYSNFKDRR